MNLFRWLTGLVALTSSLLAPLAIAAERFTLRSGGRIDGELLNRQQSPRETYEVRTSSGVTLTLPAGQVSAIARLSEAEAEYERLASAAADTVEAQWKLAEWCRERRLKAERAVHLQRILELDPDHGPARRALGYVFLKGTWTTTAEHRKSQGLQLHRGQWRTPQDIALIEAREREQQIGKEWLAKLKRWRTAGALQEIAGVRDPAAVGPLAEMYKLERRYDVKVVYLEVLAEIATPEAVQAIVHVSLNDPDVEAFHTSADLLERLKPPDAIPTYLEALKNSNNVRLNRAAHMLGRLADGAVISPLIDVLVTTHRVVIAPSGRGAGDAVSSTFEAGGGNSFQMGSSPKTFYHTVQNEEVLQALARLSGTSFGYDADAWRRWHNSLKAQQGSQIRLK